MARRKNNPLVRRSKTREYRKVFWANTEGWTEYDYLRMDIFRNLGGATIQMPKRLHPGRTNPRQVLKALQDFMKKGTFRKNDEVWIVIDVDTWGEEIKEVLDWAGRDSRFHVAISNPKFELFLIMHFEKGNGCTTSESVDARICRYIPGDHKRISQRQFTLEQIRLAIDNATKKRLACREKVPEPGMTDFYRLVERLLDYS